MSALPPRAEVLRARRGRMNLGVHALVGRRKIRYRDPRYAALRPGGGTSQRSKGSSPSALTTKIRALRPSLEALCDQWRGLVRLEKPQKSDSARRRQERCLASFF